MHRAPLTPTYTHHGRDFQIESRANRDKTPLLKYFEVIKT
jgi:hypothetical protein